MSKSINQLGLFHLFKVLNIHIYSATDKEVRNACQLILDAQSLSVEDNACLTDVMLRSPRQADIVLYPASATKLIEMGYLVRIVVAFNVDCLACTPAGADLYRLVRHMDLNSSETTVIT